MSSRQRKRKPSKKTIDEIAYNPLNNVYGASCYIDCFLMVVLSQHQSQLIQRLFLNDLRILSRIPQSFLGEYKKIIDNLTNALMTLKHNNAPSLPHPGLNCTGIVNKWNEQYPTLKIDATKCTDVNELICYFLTVYPLLANTASFQWIDDTSKQIVEQHNGGPTVEFNVLEHKEEQPNIESALDCIDTNGYFIKRFQLNNLQHPVLFIQVARGDSGLGFNEKTRYKQVIIPQMLNVKVNGNDVTLTPVGIICRLPRTVHFVCFFQYQSKWFFHDDRPKTRDCLQKIGTWEKMLTYKNNFVSKTVVNVLFLQSEKSEDDSSQEEGDLDEHSASTTETDVQLKEYYRKKKCKAECSETKK